MSKKNKRQPKMIAIAGTNGTGKTYLTKYHLLKKMKRPFLVIDSDGKEKEWHSLEPVDIKSKEAIKNITKKGAYTSYQWYEKEGKFKFWEYIFNNVDDLVLVLDDCRDFIPPNILDIPDLRNTFSRRRQKGLDIIIIQHSVDDIPKGLIRYINLLFLFNLDDTPKGIATRLNDKSIINNVKRVQKRAGTEGNQYHNVNNRFYHEIIPLKNFIE